MSNPFDPEHYEIEPTWEDVDPFDPEPVPDPPAWYEL